MKKLLFLIVVATLLHACGLDEKEHRNRSNLKDKIEGKVDSPKELDQMPEIIQTPDAQEISDTAEFRVFQGLNKYCRSCHGVGRLRFFFTESPKEFFESIKAEQSPKSQSLWVDAMIDVLSWPTELTPSFESQRSPSGDWMPIGAKRNHITEDMIEGVPARQYILQYLKDIK